MNTAQLPFRTIMSCPPRWPNAWAPVWASCACGTPRRPIAGRDRRGPRRHRDVEVIVPGLQQLRGRTPVLVDDIASSGRTLIASPGHLRALDLPPAVCVVIHAVSAGDACPALRAAGAARIASTDSIAHASSR